MQIVIDIPEEKLSIIKNKTYCGIYDAELYKAIANGVPIPEGHGRLIDADYKVSSDGRTVNSVCGYIAPTIIEADRSVEE